FFFSSRRRHTRSDRDWSSDVCSSDLRRHRDLLASRDKDTADLAADLRRTRLRLAGLLLRPGRDPDAHRAAVQKLTDEKEDLEKRSEERRVGKECRSRWWRDA